MHNQSISFPIQTESPYKYIRELINSANNLTDYNDRGLIYEQDKPLLLTTLIHLERSIDAYRVLLHPGSSTEFSNDASIVNSALDDLRSKIWEIRKQIDSKNVNDVLDSASEDFKLRFRELS